MALDKGFRQGLYSMDRKSFLRNSLKMGAGAFLLPGLLNSCAKDLPFTDVKFDGKVIIIGAGIAGLYAGYLLKEYGIDFTILEASGRAGGRMGKLEGFADFPIDTGAQWLHGDFSILGDLVKTTKTPIFQDMSEVTYWQEGEVKAALPDALTQLFAQLEDATQDISYEEFFYNAGGSSDDFYLLTGVTGDVGASPRNLSAQWENEGYALTSYGSDDYKFRTTYFDFVNDHILSQVADKIQLNTVVSSIDYTSSTVKVTDSNGIVYEGDRAVVSVPITILKAGEITFVPALPTTKTETFDHIGMEAGMKAFMRFSSDFMTDDVLGGETCAAYVVESYNRSSDDLVIFGFVMGDQAKALSDMGETAALQAMLDELDLMFGGAASASYVGHFFQDWYQEPYIRGAYSYPLVGYQEDSRERLAAPVDDKVYFAGEATNYNGHHQTVHGAVETAYREVMNILASVS